MQVTVVAKMALLSKEQKDRLAQSLQWRVNRFLPEIALVSMHFYGDPEPLLPDVHVILFRVEFRDGGRLLLDGHIRDLRDVLNDEMLAQSLTRLENAVERRLEERWIPSLQG
jgi:hypothetical protein